MESALREQNYDNLQVTTPEIPFKKPLPEKGDFAIFVDFLKGLLVPMLLGMVISSFLFLFVPQIIHSHLNGWEWGVATVYAYNDLNSRAGLIVHGDFSHYKDWAFPLLGAAIGACLRLLYTQE